MDQNPHASRIDAIDFLRGVAVLGILAVNITGFWGPSLATFSPAIPGPATIGGEAWFAFAFVVFEGKMRALFTILFGSSMILFVRAAERAGVDPDLAQVRRLGWLALFGYAHYALLWWGDILFPYALSGLAVLALRKLEVPQLLAIAIPFYLIAHGIETLASLPGVFVEQAVLSGHGAAADVAEQTAMMQRIFASVAKDDAVLQAGFIEAVRLKLSSGPFQPFLVTLSTLTETVPLMLVGMALLRGGFFTHWPSRRLLGMALAGIAGGGIPSILALRWLAAHDWPPRAMFLAIEDGMAVPHLLMALGYAAGLVLIFPRAGRTRLGQALVAAGRCAFTNYLGTTVLMSAIFCHWGLGLGPELPRQWLFLFVILGWAAMLAWPCWWLVRFGQGPLERLWRRLALPSARPRDRG
ncbi:DUF418 domain-containing protein [Novosphingobium sp. B1]|uniref:DUF418 domain-containing protein n=1 Tax=Novosphingobium sp. B1 TaxID=1938756 RepID=UPI0009D8266F|nr:DUF418 domain-containing protein [Novosphingobium sp. B1]SMC58127.1 uncharacterized protein SAMN06272759_104286 [Novosphingobium sp. B1]